MPFPRFCAVRKIEIKYKDLAIAEHAIKTLSSRRLSASNVIDQANGSLGRAMIWLVMWEAVSGMSREIANRTIAEVVAIELLLHD